MLLPQKYDQISRWQTFETLGHTRASTSSIARLSGSGPEQKQPVQLQKIIACAGAKSWAQIWVQQAVANRTSTYFQGTVDAVKYQ